MIRRTLYGNIFICGSRKKGDGVVVFSPLTEILDNELLEIFKTVLVDSRNIIQLPPIFKCFTFFSNALWVRQYYGRWNHYTTKLQLHKNCWCLLVRFLFIIIVVVFIYMENMKFLLLVEIIYWLNQVLINIQHEYFFLTWFIILGQ